MRILIVEDEPIIAMDLEIIVTEATQADCILAATVEDGLRSLDSGIDFAMLDVDLGRHRGTSLPLAFSLLERAIPFCFVSASLAQLPADFISVPRVAKPFRPAEITRMLPVAA